MITIKEAKRIVEKSLPPETVIKSAIEYGDKYLFIAHIQDELEGRFDPFFSVDKKTGKFRDFSPTDYPNPLEVITRLKEALID